MVNGTATIFFVLFLFLSRGEMNLLSRAFLLCNMLGLFMGLCSDVELLAPSFVW
jgi:hypothetical protein